MRPSFSSTGDRAARGAESTRADGQPGIRTSIALLAAFYAVLVCGPVVAEPAAIAPVEAKQPLAFPDGQPGRPSFLQTMKVKLPPPPAVIGEQRAGWFCGRTGDFLWNQATSNALLPMAMLSARMRAELEKAHYPVPPLASDSLFEEKKDPGSDSSASGDGKNPLKIGVLVKEVSANLCSKGNNAWTGGAQLKLFWQVFAPEQQKVVFETTTEGSFQTSGNATVNAPNAIGAEAFAVAARNMLADPRFGKAVATLPNPDATAAPAGADTATALPARMSVPGAHLTDEPLNRHVTQLRAAVATVVGEVGSGSGFFVGSNGLLITNQHVVGHSKFVKVRLVTGRELVGEVLRVDAVRDVALVKTEPAGVDPLPVRLTDPAIGDDVYALGSPLGDAFATTLTKGIISGVRGINGQAYLQSDVAILPGNSGGPLLDKSGQVVGITVMGLGAKGLAGMNFFMPVGDALNKLALSIVPAN